MQLSPNPYSHRQRGWSKSWHWYILWLWHFPFSVSSFPFSILFYVLVYCGLHGRKESREGWLRISCVSSAHACQAAALHQGRSSLESGWGGLWLCSRHPLSISATYCWLNVRVVNPAKYQATRGEHCSKPFLWPIFLFDWEIIHTNLKLIKIWYFKNHSEEKSTQL